MAFKLMREEVDGFLEALSDENLASFLLLVPPTYAAFTTEDPTTGIFVLCMRQWGIFVLVGEPHSPTDANFALPVFLMSQNPRNAGDHLYSD